MITLRQIQFALAVDRHHHFKRAAEECNISQSALSLGIAEMEKNLGVMLFERNNKQVITTPIGEEILKRGAKIHLEVQQLIQCAHAGKSDLSFPMRIGLIPSIAPFLLPAALPIIRQNYPNFTPNIHEDLTRRLLEKVLQGELDSAVIALPYDTDTLTVHHISEERFLLIAHQDNPIIKQKKITLDTLKKAPLMLLGEGHCISDHIADVCNLSLKSGNQYYRDASLNTLIHMTANDMGITLIPEMALPMIAHHPSITSRIVEVAGSHRKIALVTRPNYPRMAEIALLVKLFQQALAPKDSTIQSKCA